MNRKSKELEVGVLSFAQWLPGVVVALTCAALLVNLAGADCAPAVPANRSHPELGCFPPAQREHAILMEKMILKQMPAVPPKGRNGGNFSEIKLETGADKLGKAFSRLKVRVALEALDPHGKRWEVEKIYNLLGRGVRDFQADFLSWSGRLLTDEELSAFDAEAAMKGKPVVVELSHRRVGKNKLVADIEKFLPAPPPAPSND